MEIYLKEVKTDEDILEIEKTALIIWNEFFISVISQEQIDYMLEKFQSYHAIKNQIEREAFKYYLMKNEDEETVGYTGVQIREDNRLSLSKIYIKQEYRGFGFASKTLAFLINLCKKENLNSIYLTVNKYNERAVSIYQKMGFEIIKSEMGDIGENYFMDDYLMEKVLI